MFSGPFDYTAENRVAFRSLIDYLQIKLNDTLRESLGGTYGANVGGAPTRVPRAEYMLQISYGSSPENVDKLAPTVLAIIDTLKRVGPSQADAEKVKAQTLRAREVALKQNSYWVSNIAGRDEAGEDLAGMLDDSQIMKITPASVQAAARRYLDVSNYAKFVLLPEQTAPVP
jgi:zinc protease